MKMVNRAHVKYTDTKHFVRLLSFDILKKGILPETTILLVLVFM